MAQPPLGSVADYVAEFNAKPAMQADGRIKDKSGLKANESFLT
jgi:hypothetical protein